MQMEGDKHLIQPAEREQGTARSVSCIRSMQHEHLRSPCPDRPPTGGVGVWSWLQRHILGRVDGGPAF
jgi:hypothetical protein